MKWHRPYSLLVAVAALVGCSDRQPPAEPPRPSVVDPQLKALEAAKSVEGTLKEHDEARRRQIDADGAK